jgi:hypothetical protein
MNTHFKEIALTMAAMALLAGCATDTRLEREFGDSVRAVSTSQIHDMGAAQYPSKEAVTGGNVDRLENVMKSHTENVGEAQQVKTGIVVGSGSSTNSSRN